jgi:hypothetical protein
VVVDRFIMGEVESTFGEGLIGTGAGNLRFELVELLLIS